MLFYRFVHCHLFNKSLNGPLIMGIFVFACGPALSEHDQVNSNASLNGAVFFLVFYGVTRQVYPVQRLISSFT
jgi:hypothetical protein